MNLPAGPEHSPREADEIDADQIKVWFRFVPREGWLPQDTEGLWARRLGPEGDTVRFRTDDDGQHWAVERVAASDNCTVRVLPVPSGPLGRDARAVHERLAGFGLTGEVFSKEFPLLALTVPGGADLRGVKELLARGQDEGWWHFEVPCSTETWREA
ncbi:DUF4265 domain-containing protein [Streptomyces californicus]|uniref:DUF4265 domain-containing protein n=1 Tax=Streptomyces californicus TaxID=67351 RepID=UPI00296EA129|nr:DUF4265 domain-containing protein [Streptomyces californicus]MDW4917643.1 DUF4265 domain-containing protein [Streptomyces californicus]